MSNPEHFLDDISWVLDPAEIGRNGCLIPEIEDEGSSESEEEGDDE